MTWTDRQTEGQQHGEGSEENPGLSTRDKQHVRAYLQICQN